MAVAIVLTGAANNLFLASLIRQVSVDFVVAPAEANIDKIAFNIEAQLFQINIRFPGSVLATSRLINDIGAHLVAKAG